MKMTLVGLLTKHKQNEGAKGIFVFAHKTIHFPLLFLWNKTITKYAKNLKALTGLDSTIPKKKQLEIRDALVQYLKSTKLINKL